MEYLVSWRCLQILHQADWNGVVLVPQLAFLGEGKGQHAEEWDKRSRRAWRLAASGLLATQFATCWWVKGLAKNSITTGGKPGKADFWEASQWRGERQSLSQSGWYPLPRGGPWADVTTVGRCQVYVRELVVLWWSTAFNSVPLSTGSLDFPRQSWTEGPGSRPWLAPGEPFPVECFC